MQAKLEGYKRLGDGSSIELADMEFDKQKTLQDQFLAAIKRATTEITKVSIKRNTSRSTTQRTIRIRRPRRSGNESEPKTKRRHP